MDVRLIYREAALVLVEYTSDDGETMRCWIPIVELRPTSYADRIATTESRV